MKKLNLILNARWLMAVIAFLTIGVGQMWADHTKVSAGSMVSGEKYIITATYSSTTYYLVPGDIGTSSNRGSYSTSLTEAAAWTFTQLANDNWTITTMVGDDLYYLYNYSSDANSVASYSDGDDPLEYTITATSGGATTVYINGNTRYLALYTSGSNWRAYSSTSQANSQPVIQLYKVNSNFTVTYDGNGKTSGSVPVDASSPYAPSSTVTVKANTGDLARTGCTFAGWNTAADGSGTTYPADGSGSFTITANTTLYAKWAATVTWNDNGGVIRTDNIFVPAAGKSVTPPSDPSTGARGNCGDKFMGWTKEENYKDDDDAPGDLVNGAQVITGSANYYAVFADKKSVAP